MSSLSKLSETEMVRRKMEKLAGKEFANLFMGIWKQFPTIDAHFNQWHINDYDDEIEMFDKDTILDDINEMLEEK